MSTTIEQHGGIYTFDASAQTVTFSGIKTLALSDIALITREKTNSNVIIYNFANPNAGGSISNNVLTLDYDTTSMADADILQVLLNIDEIGADYNLDIKKTIEQSPITAKYSDVQTIVSTAQELDATFTDAGAEIDMKGYNKLRVWATIDIGTSTNVEFRVLGKHTSAGAEEYREVKLDTATSATLSLIDLNDYQVNTDADQLFSFSVETDGTIPYIQIQVRDSANGDGQLDSLYVTKAWN